MFQWMLFMHLAGLVLWFGSTMANVSILVLGRRHAASREIGPLVRKAVRVFGWMAHPSSVAVLVSGIVMMVEMNPGDAGKPLWLNYMEKAGGVIVIAAIAITAVLGRKAAKADRTGAGELPGTNGFAASLLLVLGGLLSVIFVVSLRL